MIVLNETLELKHRLALRISPCIQQRRRGRLKGNKQPEGWEYGVELVAPDMDFWGLEL
jgi:hypothetical protein